MTTFLLSGRGADPPTLAVEGSDAAARRSPSARRPRPAGAEAVVRLPGARHPPDPRRPATAAPRGRRRLLSAALRRRRARPAVPRLPRLRRAPATRSPTMTRRGADWITKSAGRPRRSRLRAMPRAGGDLAVAAAAAVGARFAGVDMVRGGDGARSCSRSTACRPGRGCNRCATVDIADALAASLPRRGAACRRRSPRPAAVAQREHGRRATVIRDAYEAACRAEIAALKPGNVHVFADGHG